MKTDSQLLFLQIIHWLFSRNTKISIKECGLNPLVNLPLDGPITLFITQQKYTWDLSGILAYRILILLLPI